MSRNYSPAAVTAEQGHVGQFVKVPMSLIMSEELDDKALLIWIRLHAYSIRPSRDKTPFRTWNQLALAAGVPESTFKRYRDDLFDLGLLSLAEDGLRLMIHSRIEKIQEDDLIEGLDVVLVEDEDEEISERDIIDEILAMPRRPKSMSVADRWALARREWNKWKPAHWPDLKNRDSQGMIAVCLHLKRFGLEHDSYDVLFRNVLLAVAQDDWWMNHFRGKGSMGAVFGRGEDIDDNKFTNVQSLYNEGQHIFETMPPEKLFKWDDSDLVVEHWNENSYQFKRTALERNWEETLKIDVTDFPLGIEADLIRAYQYYPLVEEYLKREDLSEDQITSHSILKSKCQRALTALTDLVSEEQLKFLGTLKDLYCKIWILTRGDEVVDWTMRDIDIPLIDESGIPQTCRRRMELG